MTSNVPVIFLFDHHDIDCTFYHLIAHLIIHRILIKKCYFCHETSSFHPSILALQAREVISSGPPEVLGNDAQTTATATIQIQVLDINDNRPQFNPNVYDVEIYEDIANNSILPTLLLTVSDIDQVRCNIYAGSSVCFIFFICQTLGVYMFGSELVCLHQRLQCGGMVNETAQIGYF